MSERLKIALLILVGIVLCVLIECLVICIGSAINGLSFGMQIVDWARGIANH